MENCKVPRIFEEMKEQEITATQLSAGTGISTGNISDWKKGKSSPSRAALTKVSVFLNVSPNYLEGTSDVKTQITSDNLSSDEKRFIELLRNSSPELRNAVEVLLGHKPVQP